MTYWFAATRRDIFAEASQQQNWRSDYSYGWPERRRGSVKKLEIGDRLIHYIRAPVCRFFGISEVIRPHFIDREHIICGIRFSECVKLHPVEIKLAPEHGVLFREMAHKLCKYRERHNPKRWGLIVKQSAVRWPDEDGELILGALREI
jgi:hypothetical protein